MQSARAQSALRRYRIERYLTEGGMGAIYLGKRLGAGGFEKEVVLKQLLPEFTSRPEFRDLFFREAKISASLDHVNIVRTYDLVRSEDALFIVMEYVPGTDLRTIAWRARLRRTPLSVAAILHVGMEVLAGLEYAHTRVRHGQSLGIIHRDVSPSNILCSGHGDVKLSDFGIAKARAFASVFYRVRGKVGYMSPEQAHNRPLDGRSDVFSAAVCLFETFLGERLYTGDLQTPAAQVYSRPLPDLRDHRPDIPDGLQELFARALAHDPADRFPSAGVTAQALRQIARANGLLYSAPQLAAELRALLGPDPERWAHPDYAVGDTERLPVGAPRAAGGAVPAGGLVGRDAESVEIEIGDTRAAMTDSDPGEFDEDAETNPRVPAAPAQEPTRDVTLTLHPLPAPVSVPTVPSAAPAPRSHGVSLLAQASTAEPPRHPTALLRATDSNGDALARPLLAGLPRSALRAGAARPRAGGARIPAAVWVLLLLAAAALGYGLFVGGLGR